MGLHWIIWVIVGAGIAVWSYTLGSKFLLFFFTGIVFVGIGVAQLLFGSAKPEKKEATLYHPRHAVQHVVPHAVTHRVAAPPTLRQSHHACPRCRAAMSPSSRFCAMCGLHVR